MSVSVVIPVKNGALFIREAIESVRTQPDVSEVLVIDDHSSDHSVEVGREAGASVFSNPGKGPVAARNDGIQRARGTYIAFLDADDRSRPERIARQRHYLDEHPEVTGVYGHVVVFSTNADGTEVVAEPTPGWLPSSFMVRRDAFARYGLFNESLVTGEVIDWTDRLRHAQERFDILDDVVADRRSHANNLSRQRDVMNRDYLRLAHEAILRKRGQTP